VTKLGEKEYMHTYTQCAMRGNTWSSH
jgi:hypothetical protein